MYKVRDNIFWKKLKYLSIASCLSEKEFSEFIGVDVKTTKKIETLSPYQYPVDLLNKIEFFINSYYGNLVQDPNNKTYEANNARFLLMQIMSIRGFQQNLDLVTNNSSRKRNK